MQMVGPWGRYLPQWLRAPCKGSGPARSTQYADGRTLGLISTLVVKGAQQWEWPRHLSTHTHTHTHWTLPTTMSVLETPFDIHVSSVYQTHACRPLYLHFVSAKKTHNKGSRTRPIMSTLMPRSGIPVICSRATLSCDSSYYILSHGSPSEPLSILMKLGTYIVV